MEIKIHVEKKTEWEGRRAVAMKVENDTLTEYIFGVEDEKEGVLKMREIVDEKYFAVGGRGEYANCARIFVNTDEEIEEMVRKIKEAYEKVYANSWSGEKEYVYTVE